VKSHNIIYKKPQQYKTTYRKERKGFPKTVLFIKREFVSAVVYKKHLVRKMCIKYFGHTDDWDSAVTII
jgi:hypothetical protein